MIFAQAELNRRLQSQLRDHSSKLQAMACLLNKIKDIMARKTLTAEERMNIISCLQIRFDKRKKHWSVTRLLFYSGCSSANVTNTIRAVKSHSRKGHWIRHCFGTTENKRIRINKKAIKYKRQLIQLRLVLCRLKWQE